MISDAAGRAEYADAGYSRLTGFATQQIVGRMSAELRSAVGADDLFSHILRALARDGEWEGRCLERRSNGNVFLVGIRVVGVGAQPDSITRLAWLITDLTHIPSTEANEPASAVGNSEPSRPEVVIADSRGADGG